MIYLLRCLIRCQIKKKILAYLKCILKFVEFVSFSLVFLPSFGTTGLCVFLYDKQILILQYRVIFLIPVKIQRILYTSESWYTFIKDQFICRLFYMSSGNFVKKNLYHRGLRPTNYRLEKLSNTFFFVKAHL